MGRAESYPGSTAPIHAPRIAGRRRSAVAQGQLWPLWLASLILLSADPSAVELEYNALRISLDDAHGSLRALEYPPVGTLLSAGAEAAGLLTVSIPLPEFPGLQLETSGAAARIEAEDDYAAIRWEQLQFNRPELTSRLGGAVTAEARIEPAPDGRSIILTATVHNQTEHPTSQILFPDLRGLRPHGDRELMELRMALGAVNPFAGPVRPEGRSPFYAPVLWREFPAAAQYQMNALRWMDLGSLDGGFSLFERRWIEEPRPNILTHRNEADGDDLRIAWQHQIALGPGETWTSPPYWLTPHGGGWAKGIEPFREYVESVNPVLPISRPARVRDGLGFQTLWIMQRQEPNRAAFQFTDLIEIAEDAHAHGIDEIMLWGWNKGRTLPVAINDKLGTVEDLIAAIGRAREIGVNLTMFTNVKNLDDSLAQRYGAVPSSSAAWTYHPEMIPAMKPFFSDEPSGMFDIETTHATWQEDVRQTFREWAERGVGSFGWDVFQDYGRMDLANLIAEIRKIIAPIDPQASFAGEPYLGSFERSNQVLDYTWNWVDYLEATAYMNVLRWPRINCNIERSARVVKMAFAEGLYINAMPKQPNQPNGTRLISEESELAAALKAVAPLRRQFLSYFTQGIPIGDSVLAKPVCRFVRQKQDSNLGGATAVLGPFEYPDIFVRAYQRSDRLLLIVLQNESGAGPVSVTSDLALWLPAASEFEVLRYDTRGELLDRRVWRTDGIWEGVTPPLDELEFSFFEIVAASPQSSQAEN